MILAHDACTARAADDARSLAEPVSARAFTIIRLEGPSTHAPGRRRRRHEDAARSLQPGRSAAAPVALRSLSDARFDSFTAILDAFARDIARIDCAPRRPPRRRGTGRRHAVARLTNIAWDITRRGDRRPPRHAARALLNDLEAMANSVDVLTADELVLLQDRRRARRRQRGGHRRGHRPRPGLPAPRQRPAAAGAVRRRARRLRRAHRSRDRARADAARAATDAPRSSRC